jgi:hypothetical protein
MLVMFLIAMQHACVQQRIQPLAKRALRGLPPQPSSTTLAITPATRLAHEGSP